jgi:hypothetical protein
LFSAFFVGELQNIQADCKKESRMNEGLKELLTGDGQEKQDYL